MARERTFPVMGTTAHLVVVGGRSRHLDLAEMHLRDLHRRWTRFDRDSDVSRLNAAGGRVVILPPDTYAVIEAAVQGWRYTRGRFDPTVADSMAAVGYDRSFERIPAVATALRTRPAPGCAGIALFPELHAVAMPPGVHLDLGGIAKGMAADMVVDELLAAGARGAAVNIGGDVRVAGEAPSPAGWIIELAPTAVGVRPALRVGLARGAVCTTTRKRRTWRGPEGPRHHLVDPGTGRPADAGLESVSIVAPTAVRAELLAKAAYLAGLSGGAELLEEAGACGVLVTDAGQICPAGAIRDFLR